MTDLELVDKYIEECTRFVHPMLLNDVIARGLYSVINRLPNNIEEAKAVARARLASMGKHFYDEEIDQIAGEIQRLEFLRKQLNSTTITDVDKLIPILTEMQTRAEFVKNYFKTK